MRVSGPCRSAVETLSSWTRSAAPAEWAEQQFQVGVEQPNSVGGETQELVRSRGPHEPLGPGRLGQWPAADACGRGRSLRSGGVARVAWWFGAAPNEDAPDQGDLIATSAYLG